MNIHISEASNLGSIFLVYASTSSLSIFLKVLVDYKEQPGPSVANG